MRIIVSFLRIFASPFHRTDHDQDESFIVFSCMRALWISDFFLRYEILCHNRACTIDHIVEEKWKQFPHWPKYFTVRFMKWNFHVNAFGSIEVLCDIPLRLDILRRIKLRRLYLFSAGGRYLLYVILRPGSKFWSYFLNICEVKAFVFLDRYGEPEKRNFCGIVLRFYIPATEDNRPFNISQMALFCNILFSRGTKKKKQWKASNHRALLLQTPIISWRYLNYLKSLINRCLNHILNLRGLLRKSHAARSSRIS